MNHCDYHIDFYMPPPIDKWHVLTGFSCIRRSYAEGAWAMLRAHYNQKQKHRLRKGQEVIAECGLQTINVN